MARAGDQDCLRQTLTVVSVGAGHAELAAFRASGCAACAAKAGCGAGALAEMLGGSHRLRLPSPMPLVPGDQVVVRMDSGAFLGAALRAYLLPPLSLVGVAAGGAVAGLPDWATAALCLPALALSLLPLARAEGREVARASLRIESRLPGPDRP